MVTILCSTTVMLANENGVQLAILKNSIIMPRIEIDWFELPYSEKLIGLIQPWDDIGKIQLSKFKISTKKLILDYK